MTTERRVTQNFKVEGAKIIFKNFSGKETEFNDEGNRNFGVLLSDEDAEMLKNDGWNVKYLKPSPDDPEQYRQPWLPVKVKFGEIPPIIYLISGEGENRRKVKLDEDTVNQLDWANIEYSDMIIRPYNYPARSGRPAGVSAYLKSLYSTIRLDDLDAKYGSIPDAGDLDEEDY
jgi:hypothetical protein